MAWQLSAQTAMATNTDEDLEALREDVPSLCSVRSVLSVIYEFTEEADISSLTEVALSTMEGLGAVREEVTIEVAEILE